MAAPHRGVKCKVKYNKVSFLFCFVHTHPTTALYASYSSRSVQQRSSHRSSATFCVSAFAFRAAARAGGAERAGAALCRCGPRRAGCAAGVRCACEVGVAAVAALPLQERLGSTPAERAASRACLASRPRRLGVDPLVRGRSRNWTVGCASLAASSLPLTASGCAFGPAGLCSGVCSGCTAYALLCSSKLAAPSGPG